MGTSLAPVSNMIARGFSKVPPCILVLVLIKTTFFRICSGMRHSEVSMLGNAPDPSASKKLSTPKFLIAVAVVHSPFAAIAGRAKKPPAVVNIIATILTPERTNDSLMGRVCSMFGEVAIRYPAGQLYRSTWGANEIHFPFALQFSCQFISKTWRPRSSIQTNPVFD